MVPNRALYQAEPRPDRVYVVQLKISNCKLQNSDLLYGLSHSTDGFAVIGCLKDPGTGDDDLCSRAHHAVDIVGLDPPVGLDQDGQSPLSDDASDLLNLGKDVLDEGLSGKAGKDRHHEDHVDSRKEFFDLVKIDVRIDGDGGAGSEPANRLKSRA